MTRPLTTTLRAALLPLTVIAALASPLAASAQSFDTQYPVERFRLSMDSRGILNAESADVPAHLTGELSAWFGYANDPLTLSREVNGETQRVASLVSERVGGSLIGSIGLFDQLELAVFVPLILMQDQDPGSVAGLPGSITSAGLGNIRLATKVQLLKAEEFAVDVSVLASVVLPSSTSEDYFGDEKTSAEFELLLSRDWSARFRTALNVGYRIRRAQQTLDLTVDDELYLHGGAAFRFTKRNEVSASLSFATGTTDGQFGEPNRNASEALVGLSHDFGPLTLFTAGGIGVSDGFGTPDWRALAGLRVPLGRRDAPTDDCGDACGAAVTDLAPSLADADQDGVVDHMDSCLDTPPGARVGDDGCTLPEIANVSKSKAMNIDMTLRIEFESGSHEILPDHEAELRRAARLLQRYPDLQIVIEGHTDDVGSDAYNQSLSEQRAAAVRRHLVTEYGVAEDRLAWRGYGESRPVADNATAEGRRRNRRVSVTMDDALPAAPSPSPEDEPVPAAPAPSPEDEAPPAAPADSPADEGDADR